MRNTDVKRQLMKVNERSDGFESAVGEVVSDKSSRETLPMIVSKVVDCVFFSFLERELGQG